MTKKDFLTDLFCYLGFIVTDYSKEEMKIKEPGVRIARSATVYTFTDKKQHKDGSVIYSLKLKSPHYDFTVEDVRKIRAFCMQRGFEITVDLYQAVGSLIGLGKGASGIIIKGLKAPWQQTAKHMSDDEVLDDALGEQKRYRPVGYFGEEEEDETCLN